MNKNTAGAVLVLILAAYGIVNDETAVWVLAAATAALAFLASEALDYSDLHRSDFAMKLNVGFALASWATVAGAALFAIF